LVRDVVLGHVTCGATDQVLIQLKYAGVNGGCETFRARGEFAFAGNASKQLFALGAEGAGIVAAVGKDVTTLSVGQAVACNSAAAFAEYGITQVSICHMAAATAEFGPDADGKHMHHQEQQELSVSLAVSSADGM